MARSFSRRHPERLREVLRDRLGLDLDLDIRVGKPELPPSQPQGHQDRSQANSPASASADDSEGEPPRPAYRDFTEADIPDDDSYQDSAPKPEAESAELKPERELERAPEPEPTPAPTPTPTPTPALTPTPKPEPTPAPTSAFFAQDLPPAPPREFPADSATSQAPALAGAATTLSPLARLQEHTSSASPEDDPAEEFDESDDDWSSVSAEDPLAGTTNEVGLAVVLDKLGGTVIEEIQLDQEA